MSASLDALADATSTVDDATDKPASNKPKSVKLDKKKNRVFQFPYSLFVDQKRTLESTIDLENVKSLHGSDSYQDINTLSSHGSLATISKSLSQKTLTKSSTAGSMVALSTKDLTNRVVSIAEIENKNIQDTSDETDVHTLSFQSASQIHLKSMEVALAAETEPVPPPLPKFRLPNLLESHLRRQRVLEREAKNPSLPHTRILIANLSKPHHVKMETAEEIETRRAKAEAAEALARALALAAAARAEVENAKKKKKFHVLQLGPMRFSGKKNPLSDRQPAPSVFGADSYSPVASRPRTRGSITSPRTPMTRRPSMMPQSRIVTVRKGSQKKLDKQVQENIAVIDINTIDGQESSSTASSEAQMRNADEETAKKGSIETTTTTNEAPETPKSPSHQLPSISLEQSDAEKPKRPALPPLQISISQNSISSSSSSVQRTPLVEIGYEDEAFGQSTGNLSCRASSVRSVRDISSPNLANRRPKDTPVSPSYRYPESPYTSLHPRSPLRGHLSFFGSSLETRRRTPRGGRKGVKGDPDTPARKAQIADVEKLIGAISIVAEKKMIKDVTVIVKKDTLEKATFLPEEIVKLSNLPQNAKAKWTMPPMLPVETNSNIKKQALLIAMDDTDDINIGGRRRRLFQPWHNHQRGTGTLPVHKVAVLPATLHRDDSETHLDTQSARTDSWWTRDEYKRLKKGWSTRKKIIEDERRSRELAKHLAEEPFNAFVTSRPTTAHTASRVTKHPTSKSESNEGATLNGGGGGDHAGTIGTWFPSTDYARQSRAESRVSSALFSPYPPNMETRPDTGNVSIRGKSRSPSRAGETFAVTLTGLTGVTAHPPPSPSRPITPGPKNVAHLPIVHYTEKQ
jgi:hypothetical protein